METFGGSISQYVHKFIGRVIKKALVSLLFILDIGTHVCIVWLLIHSKYKVKIASCNTGYITMLQTI